MRAATLTITVVLTMGFAMGSPAAAESSKTYTKDYVGNGTPHVNPVVLAALGIGDLCDDDSQIGGVFFCLDEDSEWSTATITITDLADPATGPTGMRITFHGGTDTSNQSTCGTATLPIPPGTTGVHVVAGIGPLDCWGATAGTVTLELHD